MDPCNSMRQRKEFLSRSPWKLKFVCYIHIDFNSWAYVKSSGISNTISMQTAKLKKKISSMEDHSLLVSFSNTRRQGKLQQTRLTTKQNFSGEVLWKQPTKASLASLIQLIQSTDQVVTHICKDRSDVIYLLPEIHLWWKHQHFLSQKWDSWTK